MNEKIKAKPNIMELMKNYEPKNNIQITFTEPNEDNFLSELQNDKFVSTVINEKQSKKELKEKEAEEKREAKMLKRIQTQESQNEKRRLREEKKQMKNQVLGKPSTTSLGDDDEGTEILGREKLELLAKINQYKILFPQNEQLRKLKIKKGATTDELVLYLAECDAYVATSSVDQFITDAILQSIKMGEYVSSKTRYNLTGLSDLLKKNIQFNSICKQLYLKYKVFNSVPPEHQLLLIVATSAWICLEKNKQISNPNPSLEKQVSEADFE